MRLIARSVLLLLPIFAGLMTHACTQTPRAPREQSWSLDLEYQFKVYGCRGEEAECSELLPPVSPPIRRSVTLDRASLTQADGSSQIAFAGVAGRELFVWSPDPATSPLRFATKLQMMRTQEGEVEANFSWEPELSATMGACIDSALLRNSQGLDGHEFRLSYYVKLCPTCERRLTPSVTVRILKASPLVSGK